MSTATAMQPERPRIVKWLNIVDNRTVTIYPDRAEFVSTFFRNTLIRKDVLHMTDEEWYKRPDGDGWIRETNGTALVR